MWQPEITISSEKKEMISPIENPKITSEVSPKRLHPTKKIMRSHDGADIVPKDGKKKNVPVLVPVDGKIETVKLEKDYPNDAGNRVHMKDKNGYRHSFFHLEEGIKVKSGQTVKRGDTIGIMGESGGISTGVHLHYEIRDPKGKLLNPRKANPSLTDAPGPGKAKPKP
jgi:murein DD-endopeptidase MepM/ murein hydrolase activator NlpD